jgi:hypothetical protein
LSTKQEQVRNVAIHSAGETLDLMAMPLGLIALHPHPVSTKGLACIISGTDITGIAKAAKLFPLRTGVPVRGVLL